MLGSTRDDMLDAVVRAAALDTTTAAIAERMGELRAGRTTLITTTSSALLDRMDEVVLFDDDGHLVARAPRRELLGHDGYREMLS